MSASQVNHFTYATRRNELFGIQWKNEQVEDA